jgi:hypothetical protein
MLGSEEDMMDVRAKFSCSSVTKFKSGWGDYPIHYNFKFQVVSSGSEENKKFFAATPSGILELSALKEDLFEVGKEYYLDFSPAP